MVHWIRNLVVLLTNYFYFSKFIFVGSRAKLRHYGILGKIIVLNYSSAKNNLLKVVMGLMEAHSSAFH